MTPGARSAKNPTRIMKMYPGKSQRTRLAPGSSAMPSMGRAGWEVVLSKYLLATAGSVSRREAGLCTGRRGGVRVGLLVVDLIGVEGALADGGPDAVVVAAVEAAAVALVAGGDVLVDLE